MVSSKRLFLAAALGCTAVALSACAQPLLFSFAAMPSGAAAGMHSGGQGFLGVATRTVGDPALAPLHLKEARGACVVMVDHDSPAWKAGIREHDVILSVSGTGIDGEEQLARLLRESPPGRTIQIVLSRDGAQQTLSATIADRDEVGKLAWEQHFVVPAPIDSTDEVSTSALPRARTSTFGHGFVSSHLLPGGTAYTGVMLDEIGPQLAEYFGLKSGTGLLVRSVDASSPAALAGLHAGDVVCRVNGQSLATMKDWTHALRDSKGHPVSITVMREHREQTLTIVPDGKRRSNVDEPGDTEHHWLAVLLVRPHGL